MNAKQQSDLAPQLPKLDVPWWMDGKSITQNGEVKEPAMLITGLECFWQKIQRKTSSH